MNEPCWNSYSILLFYFILAQSICRSDNRELFIEQMHSSVWFVVQWISSWHLSGRNISCSSRWNYHFIFIAHFIIRCNYLEIVDSNFFANIFAHAWLSSFSNYKTITHLPRFVLHASISGYLVFWRF